MFAQVPTRDFHLQIMPENCQFTVALHVADDKQQSIICERLGKFISTLPHTPYTAVGLNFAWHFFPDIAEPVGDACRRLFFSQEKPLQKEFDKGDARFGGYMSMDWMGCRLRLDARPTMRILPDGQQNEVIQFAFNYNYTVAGRPEPWSEIIKSLGQWDSARQKSFSILQAAIGEHE